MVDHLWYLEQVFFSWYLRWIHLWEKLWFDGGAIVVQCWYSYTAMVVYYCDVRKRRSCRKQYVSIDSY